MISTSPEVTAVGKLLLNAWSAEYALRIKPVSTDRDYLNQSLSWVFPQSYYAVFFSARAVLAVDGINIANQNEVEKLINQWVKAGKYGPIHTQHGNPFAELFKHRIKAESSTYRLSSPEVAALHVKIKEKVHAVGLIHETYIAFRLGHYTYEWLIESLPEYLKNDFVGARTRLILSDD
ncbi:HEPN domain-containing protein [Spirosoma aerophilum]